jgi:hypothetical protein
MRSVIQSIMSVALFLSLAGCAALQGMFASNRPAAADAVPSAAVAPASTEPQIQTIPFLAGISSMTVEKLALQYGCSAKKGAALITDKGPVEVYRMACDDERILLVKCELRQCKAMR